MLGARMTAWLHALLVLLASAYFELFFLTNAVNPTDEGWPLYAALRLRLGGRLYDDVFFVFPPGHALAAWLGLGFGLSLDPYGVIAARAIYAAFNVALCVAIYFLGRRLMPPRFALLGGLLVAFAAPNSHNWELLFGYRYLVWSVLALLAFARRLETGDARWLALAGLWIGIGIAFRIDATAAAFGIAAATLASRSLRDCVRDGAWFSAGLLVVLAPLLAWFAVGVGLDALWREVVVRPFVMTKLQSFPVPELVWPASFGGENLHDAFSRLLFRLPWLLYAGYAVVLVSEWVRARRAGRPFRAALLLAVVVWAAAFFSRSLGRADVAHLDSAIPPFCLLLAVAASRAIRAVRLPARRGLRAAAAYAAIAVLLGAWVLLLGSDSMLSSPRNALGGAKALRRGSKIQTDFAVSVPRIQALAGPGGTILDLSAMPIVHVFTRHLGPGYADVLMPGTLLDAREEAAFLRRLEAQPPAVVLPAGESFDKLPERAIEHTAPRVVQWLADHYAPVPKLRQGEQEIWVARSRLVRSIQPAPPGASAGVERSSE